MFGIAAIAAFIVACAASAQDIVTASSYGAQLETCVATAKTLDESQTCRCKVNHQFGRECHMAVDAGSDAHE